MLLRDRDDGLLVAEPLTRLHSASVYKEQIIDLFINPDYSVRLLLNQSLELAR